MLRKVYKILKSSNLHNSNNIFEFHHKSFLYAKYSVIFFYFLILQRLMGGIYNNLRFWVNAKSIDTLWPLFWFSFIPNIKFGIYSISLLAIVVGILVVLFPERRIIRIASFITFLQFAALANSFGKINHGLHAMIMINFLFIFLPKAPWSPIEHSISKRQNFLLVIWGVQGLLLVFYTMSGLFKIYGVIFQVSHGQMSAIHPYALAYQTASRLLLVDDVSLLGPFFIDYPILGWPLYLLVLYVETFSIVAAFRPRLHRLWGICLLMFHLGTWLIMAIPFFENMMLLGVFLIYSPFLPKKQILTEIIYQMPIIGYILSIITHKSKIKSGFKTKYIS